MRRDWVWRDRSGVLTVRRFLGVMLDAIGLIVGDRGKLWICGIVVVLGCWNGESW